MVNIFKKEVQCSEVDSGLREQAVFSLVKLILGYGTSIPQKGMVQSNLKKVGSKAMSHKR
jgi:hypothetical protein